MNARDAYAGTVYRKPFRLNLDEVVAIVALLLLVAGLVFAAMHPQPQIASCYQPTESRK